MRAGVPAEIRMLPVCSILRIRWHLRPATEHVEKEINGLWYVQGFFCLLPHVGTRLFRHRVWSMSHCRRACRIVDAVARANAQKTARVCVCVRYGVDYFPCCLPSHCKLSVDDKASFGNWSRIGRQSSSSRLRRQSSCSCWASVRVDNRSYWWDVASSRMSVIARRQSRRRVMNHPGRAGTTARALIYCVTMSVCVSRSLCSICI